MNYEGWRVRVRVRGVGLGVEGGFDGESAAL